MEMDVDAAASISCHDNIRERLRMQRLYGNSSKVKLIEHRPKYRARKGRSAEWEVAVVRPTYDLTILKLHCGKLTLKIQRTLRPGPLRLLPTGVDRNRLLVPVFVEGVKVK